MPKTVRCRHACHVPFSIFTEALGADKVLSSLMPNVGEYIEMRLADFLRESARAASWSGHTERGLDNS